ncbi:MAG: tetratricopeptide repeat protein, partial [Ketobacter sp.]
VEVDFARDGNAMINDLEKQKADSKQFLEVNEYGLACAYMKTNQLDKALQNMAELLKRRPQRITYIATQAEILNKAGRYPEAIKVLEEGLGYSPQNYALSLHYADALTHRGQTDQSIKILREQITLHETWPILWFMLAEAQGKAKDRLGVYQSKAEYYFLYGHVQRAVEQLRYALPLARENFQMTARITERIAEMENSMRDMEF